MRTALVFLTVLLIATTAFAEDRRSAPKRATRCVDVEIEGRHTYNCLNDRLRAETTRTVAPQIAAPLDNHAPDVRLGIVNVPAVQQQYGRNYGVSVVPYRPARP